MTDQEPEDFSRPFRVYEAEHPGREARYGHRPLLDRLIDWVLTIDWIEVSILGLIAFCAVMAALVGTGVLKSC